MDIHLFKLNDIKDSVLFFDDIVITSGGVTHG